MNKERFHKNFNGETIFCLENDKETFKDMILELQERIDKAIELLNKRKEEQDNGICWVEMRTEDYFDECDELINILTGGDEE